MPKAQMLNRMICEHETFCVAYRLAKRHEQELYYLERTFHLLWKRTSRDHRAMLQIKMTISDDLSVPHGISRRFRPEFCECPLCERGGVDA